MGSICGWGRSSIVHGLPLKVVAVAQVAGAPGLQAQDLLTGQAGGEERVAHLVPRRGLLPGGVLETEVAEHLHSTLVRDVGARPVGDPREHGHRMDADAVGGQSRRGDTSGRAKADDHDVGVKPVLVGVERLEHRRRASVRRDGRLALGLGACKGCVHGDLESRQRLMHWSGRARC